MSKHRFGTHRTKLPSLRLGTKVRVLLGIKEEEKTAEIRGPLREETIFDTQANVVFVRTVRVLVEGEKELREISVDRIL